jgi:hypothetical protein
LCSEPDAVLTVYDAGGRKLLTGTGKIVAPLPRGLYRVHINRCGAMRVLLITHQGPEDLMVDAPLLASPTPIVIAQGSEAYARPAQHLSGCDYASPTPFGNGTADARLFLFICRAHGVAGTTAVPSEPVSVHDLSGRHLASMTLDGPWNHGDLEAGYLALSCRVAHGTYRLRVGHARRDLAITIPAQRAAHVFLADHGVLSLRFARVYLPGIDDVFEPAGEIARAMESVLWAFDHGELPLIAHRLLDQVDRDLSFGIACAHLARRHGDRALFNRIMQALVEQAPDVPDIAILAGTADGAWGATESLHSLAVPPLFSASLLLAVDRQVPIAEPSALLQAVRACHSDSVWCTWSPRWWDEQWIEPTVERIRWQNGHQPALIEEIARATRLPMRVVERTVDRLACSISDDTNPALWVSPRIPGYTVEEVVSRDVRSTVVRAWRDDHQRVVTVEIVPDTSRETVDRLARDLAQAQRLRHKRLLGIHQHGRFAENAGLWFETDLYRDSLFDHLRAVDGPLPVEWACGVVLQALEGVAYLHGQGMVHGNLHPGTVLICYDGSVLLRPPVLDPRRSNGAYDDPAVQFAAPECVVDPAAASVVSDVWSMAATLYFLLTLELPRERYADQTEHDAARFNDVVPIAEHVPNLPRALAACVDRALAASADVRFRDARQLHEALSRAVKGPLLIGH